MINWEEFDHIHVINRLKHILGSWWGIEVQFTDERGQLRGMSTAKDNFRNPVVQSLIGSAKSTPSPANLNLPAAETLKSLVAKTLEDLRTSQNRYMIRRWDEAGFDIGIFPIYIQNDCVGTVLALGFFTTSDVQTRVSDVRNALAKFGVLNDNVENAARKLRYLDENEKLHMREICDLLAQEIVTLHLEITSREDRIRELNRELGNRFRYDNMIGKSKPMQQLYALLEKIKTADSTIMIQGENGTGKELIAKSIHYNSLRKDKPFVIQNCSAFNDNLLESELFGHVKGSFTGALKDKEGLFEKADKGTFFLDEIGDTSPQMQVKLLRVLQEGTFLPVGATEQKKVDVRIIAATNRNLKEMVEQGTFREDLYYRLNVINLRVPALRERKEDIPYLVDFFLHRMHEQNPGQKKVLTKRALEVLMDYSWPGNVRELQNQIERLWTLSGDDSKLTAEHLDPKITANLEKEKVQGARLAGKLKDALEELERDMIREGLRRTGWNKSKLAKELGISRAGLIMKVEKYGLDKRKIARS